MPLAEKISGASYVQLYALNKYFSKLLKAKQKNEGAASAEEDEAVNISDLEKAIGRKPAPQHGQVKKYSPEEIAKYEQMSAAKASSKKIRFSVREAAAECSTCGGHLSDKDIELDEQECSNCRMLNEK